MNYIKKMGRSCCGNSPQYNPLFETLSTLTIEKLSQLIKEPVDINLAMEIIPTIKNLTYLVDGESVYVDDVKYIDLGLPSGLKWADRNIGANTETEVGKYFSWGNIVGYYANEPYNFYGINGNLDGFLEPYASTKGATLLGNNNIPVNSEFDAARFNMGGSWRMPTLEEFQELYNNCTWTWTTKNGVNGYNIASKASGNSNSIFLPAGGYRNEESVNGIGSDGNYWSSSFCSDCGPCYSHSLYFYSDDIYPTNNDPRYYGFSVRAVQ